MRDEVPAWPPTATPSTAIVRSPSEAPYTAAARPAGPAPTTTRSAVPGWRARLSPTAAARAALAGLRSAPSPVITIGVSSGLTSNPRSSSSAVSSLSRSRKECGRRLRAQNSSSRRVSGEKREPTTLSPTPWPTSIARRSRKVRRITSLSSGSWAITSRSCSGGTAITVPGSRTTAVR